MSRFLPLPPGLAQRLIAGTTNELAPLSEDRMRKIQNKACPRCKSAMHPFINPKHVFSPDDPLPRMHARCTDCGCEWDPVSDLILHTGDPRKVENPVPIIRPDED